jgi:hypothetical protein
MTYPTDVDDSRPMIVFYCNGRTSQYFSESPTTISFPIPQGLDFSDGASWDDTSFSAIGKALVSAGRNAFNESSLGAAAAAFANTNVDTSGVGVRDIISRAVGTAGGSSDMQKISAAASQTITNPNVITEFTGIGTRSFSFKFKMVASNKTESDMIRDICHSFRLATYPEGNILGLRYPPKWNIYFRQGGNDMTHVPKIFDVYITNVNVGYNSSGNSWYKDGTPVETDLTVGFKEARALTAQDIHNLHIGNRNAIPAI